MLFPFIATLLAASSLVAAAPTANYTNAAGTPTVLVENNCAFSLRVGHSNSRDIVDVDAGRSYTYNFPINWSGRIWGRRSCSGNSCFTFGKGTSVSLAEFSFPANGLIFYDISLVDGFNLPMVIEPDTRRSNSRSDARQCNTITCRTLPSCPSGFHTYDDKGIVSGCMSACTKFNTDEYCCTGAYNKASTCKINSYASQVKDACPDAYSYAYDDITSTFICRSYSYTLTFC